VFWRQEELGWWRMLKITALLIKRAVNNLLKLIVNGDDLGYSPGVNQGIIRAMEQGIVTSTTLLMNRQFTKEAIDEIKAGRVAKVGIHLCLTSGRPLSEPGLIPELVDREGCFLGRDYMLQANLSPHQVERELRTQLVKALAAGIRVTHLDSHHHVHQNRWVLEVMVKLAREYALPIRSVNPGMAKYVHEQGIITPTGFIGDFYGGGVSSKNLIRLLQEAREKFAKQEELQEKKSAEIKGMASKKVGLAARDMVIELMVHPAYMDEYLLANSNYTHDRERELRVLMDGELAVEIDRMGYKLISYGDITASREQ